MHAEYAEVRRSWTVDFNSFFPLLFSFSISIPTLAHRRDLFNFLGEEFPRVSNGRHCAAKHVSRTNRFRDTRINKTFNRIHRSSNFLEDRRSISRFTALDKLLNPLRGRLANGGPEKKRKKEGEDRNSDGRGKKKGGWQGNGTEGKKIEHVKQTSPVLLAKDTTT